MERRWSKAHLQRPPTPPLARRLARARRSTARQPARDAAPPASQPADTQPGLPARAGAMRRRARFLRKARELAYRDLGGLVFNLHRFGQRNDALVLAKLDNARPDRRRAAHARRSPRRAPAGDGAARGRHHRLPALRGDPQQRGPLLPQLRARDGPSRRAARRRTAPVQRRAEPARSSPRRTGQRPPTSRPSTSVAPASTAPNPPGTAPAPAA